ncbi:PHP domain-containing protein [Petroclostridium sp. X23]|uniref:PHP domain-containing protein n=1 Tax=Petroclostridium sp. X23 TaxID=3045146 RepID=UPI0024ADCAC7|nr:PHP domain-containing protein [Petroclostridium sp. X23]WHH59219.1 PHP domain-containing protein [Petroclostridium sp. X23]
MRYSVDLHIHTALSPCADRDMTPNNIVNMAILKGLDFISITDHNAAGNIQSIMECAKGKDLTVIPGMEIESSEEVHVLCYFCDIYAVKEMEKLINRHMPNIENRPDIFGSQELYDSKDEIIGYQNRLLLTATSLPINRIKAEVEKLGGVVVPSHVDRQSFSIISNLGFISEEMGFATIEISKHCDKDEFLRKNPDLIRYKSITNSDAHHLFEISEADEWVDLVDKSAESMISYLKVKNNIVK